MGILNVTPDSFSDGGRHRNLTEIVAHAATMLTDGVDIIDIGGESTRPGSDPVTREEEIKRVVPAVRAIYEESGAMISVDTTKATVAAAALDAGAAMVNDVSGLRFDPDMAALITERRVPVVIMHMRGTPSDMQDNPLYDDVVKDIESFFRERLRFCEQAGIDQEQIILDPGIGFGKTMAHNLAILAGIKKISGIGPPVLIGHSRKSFLSGLLGLETPDRDCATAMISCLCAARGVDYIRVHNVKLTRQAITIANRIMP